MEQTNKGIYRWITLGILALAFSSTFISRFVWAPLIPAASGELGLTMAQAGNLMSAFYFGYLFTQIPAGFLADRFRVKYMMFTCVALVGVATFAMSSVQSYTEAYVIRFVAGIIGGFIMAFCSRILSNNFAPRERGLAFGVLLAGPSVGTLIANQAGPRVLNAMGWRAAFQAAAIIIAIIAVLIVVVIREPAVEKGATASKPSFVAGLKNYFTNPQILILSVVGFLFMAIPAGYSTWSNKFMTGVAPGGAGLTPVQAGTIITVYSVLSILGSISSGFIAKKFNINPKTFIIVIYVIMAVSLVGFGMQTTFVGLLAASAIFGLVSCMSSTHLTSWAVNMGGNKYAATTTSVQNLLFQSSNVIFPTVAGSIIDKATTNGVVTSYMGVWGLFGALLIGSAVIAMFASKKSATEAMK